jgi:hypothetical protein
MNSESLGRYLMDSAGLFLLGWIVLLVTAGAVAFRRPE